MNLDKLKELQHTLFNAIEEEKIKIEKERHDFEKEKEIFFQIEKKLNQNVFPKRIRLDVGGTIYSTSLSTLTRFENSFFGAMFSGRYELVPEEDCTFFIDRDPFVFRHVLNYMRGRELHLEFLTPEQLVHLKEDAEFYQLEDLIDLLSPHIQWDALGKEGGWDKSKGSALWTVSHNGRLAKKVYKPSYITIMRTKQPIFTKSKFQSNLSEKTSVSASMLIVGPGSQSTGGNRTLVLEEVFTPINFDFHIGLVEESFTSEKEWLRNTPGVIFYLDLLSIEAKTGDYIKLIIDANGAIYYQINNGDKVNSNKVATSDLYIAVAVRDVNYGAEIIKVDYKNNATDK